MKRVPYETMVNEFKRVLVKKGFTEDRAEAAAVIFAQNSLAGVYSHGLNRLPGWQWTGPVNWRRNMVSGWLHWATTTTG